MSQREFDPSRRDILRYGMGSASFGLTGVFATPPALAQTAGCAPGQNAIEAFPTSPLILEPFREALPIPQPLKPVPASSLWPNPQPWTFGQQDSTGSTHQLGPEKIVIGKRAGKDVTLPAPLVYHIRLMVGEHHFTHSPVMPINASGQRVSLPNGVRNLSLQGNGSVASLPANCCYTFNGTFPGPMINAEYFQPVLIRFDNKLDDPANEYNGMDRQNFGDPNLGFLTHLHNAHTAPESDGNPNYRPAPYQPNQWVDNLYLNWPAGDTLSSGDDKEKQSFFWFHDHRMDHTGANVYKGMMGLYPIYDPEQNKDAGDETKGFRLPGVRTNQYYPDGTRTFKVDYDIPLALYDCSFDDGVTPHQDAHTGCGETHPEWWGKLFFRHFPNHGFVGDVFTVNGKAFPVMEVKRRRYRLRFLDASIARVYRLQLMNGNNGYEPMAFPGQQGQYNLVQKSGGQTRRGGQRCMKFVQIASEGGLLPFPILRDAIEVWPAKRREVIVDFSKFEDGTPTKKGDVIYLTNTLPMKNGRKPDDGRTTTDADGTVEVSPVPDPTYAVPILKIVIGDDAPDNSFDPLVYANGTCSLKLNATTKLPLMGLRALPTIPQSFQGVTSRTFELQRSGMFGGETQWLINNRPFEATAPLAYPIKGSGELWTLRNGGGGWVHPFHMHMEEHRVISRNGVPAAKPGSGIDYSKSYGSVSNPDPGDAGKEDVVALKPGEEVTIYRRFRTFTGKYVAHCHNLAHEDHAMMFGWEIVN